MLAALPDVLAAGAAVGAFNTVNLEQTAAIVAGAEAAGLPVVLQVSENAVRYVGALEPLAAVALLAARRSSVPVVVHLDHATRLDLVDEAIALGFTSVMVDASASPYAENVAATAEVVRRAHARGVAVEAELGEVGGKDGGAGAHAAGVRTGPADAARFVAATGVDALAVAVGSSHAMIERSATLDLGLIAELRAAVDVPLVLHGSSGVPDGDLVRAVSAGMAKINVGTHLNAVFTGALRQRLAADPDLVDARRYLGPARDAMAAEVARLLPLLRHPPSREA